MSDKGEITPIAHNEEDNKNVVRLAPMWQQSGTLLFDSSLVLVLVLVDTQQSSQRSITLRSICRQQISPKIL